jgi:hypothetical protein
VIAAQKVFIKHHFTMLMGIELMVRKEPLPEGKGISYHNYSNFANDVLWFVKDVPFEKQPKGLFGYCQALSTKHIGINDNLRQDKNELELTIWHEELHKNGILDEYAVRAIEASASIPAFRYKVITYYN